MNTKNNINISKILVVIAIIIVVIWLIYWFFFKKKEQTSSLPSDQLRNNRSSNNQPGNNQSSNNQSGNQSNRIINSPFTIYYFYHPNCIHCTRFTPRWKKVKELLQEIKGLSIREVNVADNNNKNLVFYYGVDSYPTIILSTPNRTIEYTGNLSSETVDREIYQFVSDIMVH